MVTRAHPSHHLKRHLDRFTCFSLVPDAMLYNALSMGKKIPKIAPSPWDFVIPPEEDRATAIGNVQEKCDKYRACGSGVILAERHTDTHTQTCSLQYFATTPASEVKIKKLHHCQFVYIRIHVKAHNDSIQRRSAQQF